MNCKTLLAALLLATTARADLAPVLTATSFPYRLTTNSYTIGTNIVPVLTETNIVPNYQARILRWTAGGDNTIETVYRTATNTAYDLSGVTSVVWRYKGAEPWVRNWHSLTGTVYSATGGVTRVYWTTAAEAGFGEYDWDETLSNGTGTMLRAFGTLYVVDGVAQGPGIQTNTPRTVIDWLTVDNQHSNSAPWYTQVATNVGLNELTNTMTDTHFPVGNGTNLTLRSPSEALTVIGAWGIGDVVTNAIDALARSYTNQAQTAYDWINAFVTNDLLRTAAIATWTEGDLSGVAWASFVRTNNPALSDARAPLAHNQPLSTITNAGDLAGSNYTATANAILASAQGSSDGRYVRSDAVGTNTVGVDFSSTITGWDGPINTVGSSYTSGQFLDTWLIPGYEFPDILPSGFHRWSSAFPISIVAPPYYVWGSNNIALDWRGFRSDYDATGDTDVVNYRTMAAGLTGKVGTNDSRLTDARTPLAHTQDASTISNAPWWVSGQDGDGSALTGVVVSVVESDPIFTNWVATNVVVATESDPVYTAAIPSIVFANNPALTNSRPTTSTLEAVVANGGTVAGNAVTIDAANARTNTYGGGLVKLGPRIQAGSMVNASTNNTIALGVEANALHANSFIWNSGLSRVRNTSTNGEFNIYADGGFLFDGGAVSANGVNLGAGAANGNTAYGWGNHAGLYDVTGAAVSVSNALAAGAAAGSAAYTGLTNQWSITKDPSGFGGDTLDDIGTFAYDTNSRVLTLTNATAMPIYRNGSLLTNSTSYTFPACGTNRGVWFVKFRQSDGAMSVSQTPWTIDDIQVATVYRGLGTNSQGLIGEETHGLMPWTVHQRFHADPKLGASYVSGLTVVATNAKFTMTSGTWLDEDINHVTSATVSNGIVCNRDGTTGYLNFIGPRTQWYRTNAATGALQYDLNGTLTDVSSGGSANYISQWAYAVPIEGADILWVVGRSQNTLSNIRLESPPDLSSLLPAGESVLLSRVILRSNLATYIETTDYRRSSVSGSSAGVQFHATLAGRDVADQHPASAISTTSSYGNVEAAIAAIGSGTGGSPQSPWTNTINAAGFSVTNYGAGDSFLTPTVLTSASTVTITRAHLNRWSLRVTNSPCTITFQMADWPTNGSGFCRGDIFSGTNAMILNATTIRTNANYPISFSTSDVTRLMFDRPALAVTNKFDVRP